MGKEREEKQFGNSLNQCWKAIGIRHARNMETQSKTTPAKCQLPSSVGVSQTPEREPHGMAGTAP